MLTNSSGENFFWWVSEKYTGTGPGVGVAVASHKVGLSVGINFVNTGGTYQIMINW